ncbi:hypothetical protein [Solicola gregarius]|uniref:Uncharacterized protein n=1 Tax=Solicola gregarius TaxID=2908642 RepID=A0AA46YJR1_9ACTN|nr:hypothetical protein [Solicola gregarius]UYM04617.1 hypothetical protein L0C25_19095 [Solicola gregarius]
MSFNQPILNEMMARETLEYRARDLEAARRSRLARTPRPSGRRTRPRISFTRIRHAVRRVA